MKTRSLVALAMLAGIALGSLGTKVLNAQKPPSASFIADVFDISNANDFNTYAAGVPATVEKYGGRYLVREPSNGADARQRLAHVPGAAHLSR